jgi:hypothetical protein
MEVPTEAAAMRKVVAVGIAVLAVGAFGGGYVVGVGAARRSGDAKARDSIRTLAMLVRDDGRLPTDVERALVELDEDLRRESAWSR